ncbi:hypothetical protein SODALDRAFT_28997 [Sodiomyces alkalinus F11]|uniref:Serine-threonine rich protein n=1 Tax=Sodiomyces alkalinus (strain CBS 110278 / VKM F-3762 / F11) TaxID=1314773 RepID=A0A3N2Q8C9_SODAK|nr:hypothetical protein SODALDRAFT_28997 [Sodiomyces alkalinus F11]ROT43031.1 hypothetical protein SODALDRAFT_28997 [Sodiomyces alkalinus F11]
MLMTGLRAPPRTRMLRGSSSVRHQLLGFPTSALLVQSRHSVQARGFHFDRWSSHLGSECRGDLHRSRPRRLRYKYISSCMTRALSWHQHPTAEDPKAALKKLMARYWDASAPSSTGRYADVDKVKSWSDELSGVRPGRNIEDVERSAINHLFRHNDPSSPSSSSSSSSASAPTPHPYEYDPWQSPLQNIRNLLATQNITEIQSDQPGGQVDSLAIDPITNRRVTLQALAGATSVIEQTKANQVSHSHFSLPDSLRVEPVHSDGPPSAKELQRYSQVKFDDKPWQPLAAEPEPCSVSDLDKYKPVVDETPAAASSFAAPKYDDLAKYKPTDFTHGPNAASASGTETKYDDLPNYEPVMWREPDGLPPLSAEERSKMYTDLGNYGPVQWREPDGLPQPTAEELSKTYDDLHTYGPTTWNEPDGKLPLTTEELSKQYDDLHQYAGPYTFNEPDGKLPPSSEELSKKYTDLHKYGDRFSWNEPDGLPAPTAEERSKKYTDLRRYGPVSWNEPDGKMPLTAEEASKQYADLGKYGKVEWNEPDGKPAPTAEEAGKRYTDLNEYSKVEWNEPDGKPTPTTEEASKRYTDLNEYSKVEWNEPDGKPTPTPEETSKQYTDLDNYGKVEWNEPDGQPGPTRDEVSKRYSDLTKYGKVVWNEPDGMPPPTAEEASKDYTDLHRYGKVQWNEPDGKAAPTPEEASKRYTDLHNYDKFEWNEPEGKPMVWAEESSKKYVDLHRYGPVQWNEPDGKLPIHPKETSKRYADLHRYNQPFQHEPSETAEDLDLLRPSDIRANMAYKTAASSLKSDDSEALEKDMSEYAQTWDNANKAAKTTIQQAKIKASNMDEAGQNGRQLSGNYVRDFPEDFQASWGALVDQNASSGQAANKQTSLEGTDVDIASLDESFPTLDAALDREAASTNNSKLEPALHRVTPANRAQVRLGHGSPPIDPYSKEPQGLELGSMEEECARNAVKGESVNAEGSAPRPDQEPPAEKTRDDGASAGAKQTKKDEEPSQYKILAYDPTLETVVMAETTSTVPDTMAPLSPAEVLQRLSNPVKFFPHLELVGEEGYEMISGSGNVLVLRKVRDGKPSSHIRLEQRQPPTRYHASHVNPIDMMGSRPVTPHSFSASPTGYVSYDADTAGAAADRKPPPPFTSRTETETKTETVADETTGSARKNSDGNTGKSKRRGRKMVLGAIGVGGLSYSVGVLGEYFRTGGAEGSGQPTRV